jgi:ADP-ribose pyrophosphatase YjhB (NUDIX family)
MHAGRALFVQRGENPGQGRWTIPGGYVEEDETPDVAVVREVREETGLLTRVQSLLAIRNTLRDDDQNAYYVFKLELAGPPEIVVDGRETVAAKFFASEEFDSLADLAPLSRWIAEHYAGAGLKLVETNGRLKPLVGKAWALFGSDG